MRVPVMLHLRESYGKLRADKDGILRGPQTAFYVLPFVEIDHGELPPLRRRERPDGHT
jgi:hypothetical protein